MQCSKICEWYRKKKTFRQLTVCEKTQQKYKAKMPQNKTNRANDTSIKSMYVNVHVFIREYIPWQ